jgi:conjugal transfer pilus assembly protein TraW
MRSTEAHSRLLLAVLLLGAAGTHALDGRAAADGPPARAPAETRAEPGSPQPAHREAAEALLEAARAQVLGSALAPPDPQGTAAPGGRRVTVFASLALDRASLRALFAATAGREDTVVVFRGVPRNERLVEFLATVHGLIDGLDPPPAVVIDPRPFADARVSVAPEIRVTEGDTELARVRGLVDPAWLLAQVAAGRRGDLGAPGPTVGVVEPDLREAIAQRLAGLDWAGMREGALARFWARVPLVALPEAAAPRERRLDPTVRATADLRAPDGTVVVRAGEAVNPLAQVPFTRRLVVFDGTRPAQVQAARRLAEPAGARTLFLASALDREGGWEALAGLEATLGAPVYLLTPELQTRLGLERVPAEVHADGLEVVVREVVP